MSVKPSEIKESIIIAIKKRTYSARNPDTAQPPSANRRGARHTQTYGRIGKRCGNGTQYSDKGKKQYF